jgi:hypothetical protein
MPAMQVPRRDAAIATQARSAAPQGKRQATAKIGLERMSGAAMRGRGTPGASEMLALQKAVGNRAMAGLVQARKRSSTEDLAVQIQSPEVPIPSPYRMPTGPATALPPTVHSKMQRAFGVDLSAVRIREDSSVAELGALAMTSGDDIAFAPGAYAPHTSAGQELLGHELSHVVQQRAGRVSPQPDRAIHHDPGLEREADHHGMLAARGGVIAATSANTGTTAMVVQPKFTLVRKTFTTKAECAGHKALRNWCESKEKLLARLGFADVDDCIAAIGDMAEAKLVDGSDEDFPRFPSYDALVNAASDRRSSMRLQNIPPPKPIKGVKTGHGKPYDRTKSTNDQKLKRLKSLQRQLSDVSLKDPDIKTFRNVRLQMELESSKYQQRYTIGHTSNFLLGGKGGEHTYEALIDTAKSATGFNNKQLADYLLKYMLGAEDVFDQFPDRARETCIKIAALIHGAEFRRAATNPVAAVAVLNHVIITNNDLYQSLREMALFVASENDAGVAEGGSMRSQWHRRTVDTKNADFIITAVNEYDAMMQLAADNDVDLDDDAAVTDFLRSVMGFAMQGMKAVFAFGPLP